MWILDSLSPLRSHFRFAIRYPIRFCLGREFDHAIVRRILNRPPQLCNTESVWQSFAQRGPSSVKGTTFREWSTFGIVSVFAYGRKELSILASIFISEQFRFLEIRELEIGPFFRTSRVALQRSKLREMDC